MSERVHFSEVHVDSNDFNKYEGKWKPSVFRLPQATHSPIRLEIKVRISISLIESKYPWYLLLVIFDKNLAFLFLEI